MGPGKRRFFTPAFKAQAVKLVIEGEHPISQIAGDLGIGEGLPRRWRREHDGLWQRFRKYRHTSQDNIMRRCTATSDG